MTASDTTDAALPPDIQLILATLLRDEDEAAAAAASRGATQDSLLAWRLVLVDAGLVALAERLAPVGWVQAELIGDGSPVQSERLLRGPLLENLQTWVHRGIASNAWYLHKPPGMRLRLEGDVSVLRDLLPPVLDRAVAEGGARGWRYGVYLPESYLFGGSDGTALAHRFFTADSLAVLAYHRARLARRTALGPAEFSLVLLDGLLRRLLDDHWERWDVWCRLESTRRLAPDPPPQPDSPAGSDDALRAVRSLLERPASALALVSEEEQAILNAYETRVADLALHVQQVLERGGLMVNVRAVLPFWIVFHWNRVGFGLETQRALAELVVAALDPREPTRV